MNYKVIILSFLTCLSIITNAQSFLSTPVSGIYRKDYMLVNYVDWSFQGHMDAYCGTKSYDGHQGSDFVIRSFSQMDSGVSVLAADSGLITFIQDGIFDRETIADTSKGLGNYIAIRHPNSYYSYYGHLKKNSLLVKVGDTVRRGQKIAEIGSSGNSSDPHLHFELWFDSLYVVDPFQGDCGNDSSLWLNPLPYDTSLNVWEYGLYLKNIDLNVLRNREQSSICCPYEITQGSSDTLSFWAHLYGLRAGDTLSIDWLDSSGLVQFSYDFPLSRDWWYYYFWSYIKTDSLILGNWNAVLSRNRKELLRLPFEVKPPIITRLFESDLKPKQCPPYTALLENRWQAIQHNEELKIYQLDGKSINPNQFFSNQKELKQSHSIYIVKTLLEGKLCTYKAFR